MHQDQASPFPSGYPGSNPGAGVFYYYLVTKIERFIKLNFFRLFRMSPTPMNNKPGVIKPLLADSPEIGYETILMDLSTFYSPIRTDRGLTFKGTRESVDPPKASKKTWYNKLYEGNTLCAKINVQLLNTEIDRTIPPARLKQIYGIYFNFFDENGTESEILSFQERDAFLAYL